MINLDKFDKQILEIMQVSNRTTSETIAESIGLSPASVQRRIKRLRDASVIQADVSVISPKAVGRPMTFIVQITLERERLDLMDTFKDAMKNNPQVQQCYYVTGSVDFVIVMTAADMAAYEEFTNKYFFDNANIKHFNTSVVMNSIKTGMYIPVETD